MRTRPLLASPWPPRGLGGLGAIYALSGTIHFLRQRRVYLSSKTPFLLDPLPGLGFLLFRLESQKLVFLPSFLIISIKNVLDLSVISIEKGVRDKSNVQRLNSQGGAHPIAPAALLLDILYLPLFSVNLVPDLVLGLAVSSGSLLSVVVGDVIQGVPKLIETREYRHCGIGMDMIGGWRRG